MKKFWVKVCVLSHNFTCGVKTALTAHDYLLYTKVLYILLRVISCFLCVWINELLFHAVIALLLDFGPVLLGALQQSHFIYTYGNLHSV